MTMNKNNILSQIQRIEDQISILSDREYNPDISPSEQRELSKRKKKLNNETNRFINNYDAFNRCSLIFYSWGVLPS